MPDPIDTRAHVALFGIDGSGPGESGHLLSLSVTGTVFPAWRISQVRTFAAELARTVGGRAAFIEEWKALQPFVG